MPITINPRELRARRAEKLKKAEEMVKEAELDDRDFNDTEKRDYEALLVDAAALLARAERLEKMPDQPEGRSVEPNPGQERRDEDYFQKEYRSAFMHWIKTGDKDGVRQIEKEFKEFRASNDTDMNIGTDADGGYAVPTGHYQGIIARRDEMSLVPRLGIREIPGKGTTVNVPVDNEDDGEFVSTNEAANYDRDAPAIDQKAMTLVKYTKRVEVSEELLEDEDSRLMAFLNDFIGRGMAKTHNNLIITEAGANGTSLKTFASATVIAVDELEPIIYNDALDPYLDDSRSVAWVMRRSVHGEIILLDDTSIRRYGNNQQGNEQGPSLLGFPVAYTIKSGATAASAKSVYFGNWNFMGVRNGAGFSVIRDPYTLAISGQIRLTYGFRTDYAVLQAEAIGYGEHPSA